MNAKQAIFYRARSDVDHIKTISDSSMQKLYVDLLVGEML